jgi:glycine dehydrogenase subunit 1
MDERMIGGIELSKRCPELGNATPWCAMELVTRESIDASARILAAAQVVEPIAT